jgi:hypothetical protein
MGRKTASSLQFAVCSLQFAVKDPYYTLRVGYEAQCSNAEGIQLGLVRDVQRAFRTNPLPTQLEPDERSELRLQLHPTYVASNAKQRTFAAILHICLVILPFALF